MLAFNLIVALALSCVSAKKMQSLQVHEKVLKMSEASLDANLELSVSLKQNNLDLLKEMLMQRSDPKHDLYQQWLTPDELGEYVRNDEAFDEISKWLKENQVSITWTSQNNEHFKATATVSVWQSILDTTFFEWSDQREGAITNTLRLAETYNIPDHLEKHIFSISASTLPITINRRNFADNLKPVEVEDNKDNLRKLYDTSGCVIDKLLENYGIYGQCITTPSFLKSFYGVPSDQKGDSSLSQAIFAFQVNGGGFFSNSDLSTFQSTYGLPKQSVSTIHGGDVGPRCTSDKCGEGNLDTQIITTMSQGTKTVYWTESDSASGDPFLDFLIEAQSWKPVPSVLSISYGASEIYVSTTGSLFNTEAMKLGLIGSTIFVSTGDNGVTGNSCSCGYYVPTYPASSPYVVAVGATMNPASGTVIPEIVCSAAEDAIITTGGGFSSYFTTYKGYDLSFQANATKAYKNSKEGKSAVSGYSSGRGYPDVAFLGSDYVTCVGGVINSGTAGTSASAPAFAGMISLINAYRKTIGLGTVGWINPTLYRYGGLNSSYFNDVTSGNNNHCSLGNTCTNYNVGFSASTGWDPATGWGSIQWEKLKSMFDSSYTSAPSISHLPTTTPTVAPKKSSSCFSGSDTVQLESSETKSFDKVQIGDKILVASMDGKVSGFSPVVALPHPVNSQLAEFIRIETASGRDVRMTRDHLVMGGICGSLSLVSAEYLKTGNCVKTVSGEEVVSVVSVEKRKGVYSAVTMAGGLIVVNGVIASPFAVNHVVADSFYAVHRLIFKMFHFYLAPTGVLMKAINVFGDLVTA